MESLIILIPLALILTALAVGIFFWAVSNGQFDDLDGPAHSILFDEPDSALSDYSIDRSEVIEGDPDVPCQNNILK